MFILLADFNIAIINELLYVAPRATGAAIAPPPSLMDLDIPTPDFLMQKQAAGMRAI